jgi:undecaprenyl-phosphate 4-deoxy-4-formamido-L-arabinose transferase
MTSIESDRKPAPSISVVIPVYNSEGSLPELVERLQQSLISLTRHFEVILVNDGSRDRSWEVICQIAQTFSWVHGINLMRNYGQHNALLCGIRAAKYEVIVTMDDDLQHPPEEISKLLAKMAEGYDVVYGAPLNMPHSWWRNALSKYTKLAMARSMGIKNVRNLSAFRALKTELRNAFADYHSPDLMLDALLAWGTVRFAVVMTKHLPRQVGKSNYNFLKLFGQTMLMFTGFSTGPLRLASWIGFGFTFLGMGVLVYVVGRFFIEGGSVAGFPFLASVIAIFSGAQMFALGILGEYLARIFNRSMERPTYMVQEITDQRNETN